MVSNYLIDYLSNTRISLSQLADKLGISKGYLSDIKNSKKVEPAHLGTKILKMCGATSDAIRNYVESKQEAECRIYADVKQHASTKLREKLAAEEVSNKIATDLSLFNAYHDIVSEKELVRGELVGRYGTNIVKKLAFLVDRNFIVLENNTYSVDETRHTEFANRSIFKVLVSAIQNEANQFDVRENLGITRFYCHEIEEEALKALNEMKRKHYAEEVAFMNKHIKAIRKGGIRVLTASVSTCLQRMILIVGLAAFGSNLSLKANGPGSSGGGTDPGGEMVRMLSTSETVFAKNSKPTKSNTSRPFYFDVGFGKNMFSTNNTFRDKKITKGFIKKANHFFNTFHHKF